MRYLICMLCMFVGCAHAYNYYDNHVVFNRQGIDNIAYVTGVKNEDDIVYDNLRYHFALGFRKFVIIDNNSDDNTTKQINQFYRETKQFAKVIRIHEPTFDYIQAQRMTVGYEVVKHIMPEVEWVFLIDADEFLTPTKNMQETLADVPPSKQLIKLAYIQFFKGVLHHRQGTYYDTFVYLPNNLVVSDKGLHKVIIRNHLDIKVQQGNHDVWFDVNKGYITQFLNKKYRKYINAPDVSGKVYALSLREYHVRSPLQAYKKLYNGALANLSAKKHGKIFSDVGVHWDSFKYAVDQHGMSQATRDYFNQYVIDEKRYVYSPLPIAEGIKIYNDIVKSGSGQHG